MGNKYHQPYNCRGRDDRLSQKIHNAEKHGEPPAWWWYEED